MGCFNEEGVKPTVPEITVNIRGGVDCFEEEWVELKALEVTASTATPLTPAVADQPCGQHLVLHPSTRP